MFDDGFKTSHTSGNINYHLKILDDLNPSRSRGRSRGGKEVDDGSERKNSKDEENEEEKLKNLEERMRALLNKK